MSSPKYDTVVVSLTSQIDTLMNNFIFNGYNALVEALTKPLAALSLLFIVLAGYGITHGFIQSPLKELYKFSLRLGFIYFFAMNWGNFSAYMVGLFIDGAGHLGATLMKGTHLNTSSGSITQGLQSVFTEVIKVGTWTIKKASIRHLGPYYTAIMIYISGIAVVLLALFEIVVAKIMLAICLCTAPFFFLFTLFEKTRVFFDRWLGFVVGYSLVLILVSSVVGLCMSLIHWSVAGYMADHAASIDSVGWIPIFIISALSVVCISQSASIAKNIGGACHTTGGSSMALGLMGGVMGGAMALKSVFQKERTETFLPQVNNAQNSNLMTNIHNSLRGEP